MYCEICCWYDAYTVFDDSLYSQSKLTTNGYNTVINQNGFNKLNVCNECLIQNIYVCDIELKHTVLEELVLYVKAKIIQKWWITLLYCIDNDIGKNFIYKQISKDTKIHFKLMTQI